MATNAHQARQIATLERAEDERREEERARFASKVVCWTTMLPENSRVAVRIVNSSELPVYEVTVYVGTNLGASRAMYRQIGPSGGRRRILGRPTRALETLLPNYADGRTILDSGITWVAMTFRDTSDRWWFRDPRGVLHSATSQAEAAEACQRAISDWNGATG